MSKKKNTLEVTVTQIVITLLFIFFAFTCAILINDAKVSLIGFALFTAIITFIVLHIVVWLTEDKDEG